MASTKSHWPLTMIGGGVSIASMALPFVLVRNLPPEFIGQYKIFFLYLVLVPWFAMTAGLTNGLSYWAGHDDRKLQAFRNSWSILVAMATFTLALGVLCQPLLVKWLGWNQTEIHLFLCCAFVQILSTFFEEASISQGHIWRGALFASGFDLLQNTSILIAALVFRTVEAVFWANLIVMGTKLGLGMTLGYRTGFQRFGADPELRKAILRYAGPVSLSAALQGVMNYCDQLLLAGLISAEHFAVYSVGCLSIAPLSILELSVNRVVIPRLSRAFATGNPDQARRLLRESTSELSWLFFPSAVGLFIYADPIIALLFTKKYAAAAIFLRISAFKWVLMALPLDQIPRARARGGWIFKQLLVFSALSLVLVFTLTKFFGAMGALIGLVATIFLMRVNAILYIRRTEGWSLRELLPWGDWGRYVLSAALGAAASYLIRPWIGDGLGGLRWFLSGGSLFSIIYMTGTLGTFLKRRLDAAPRTVELHLARPLEHEGGHRETLDRAGVEVISLDGPTAFSFNTAVAIARLVVRRRVAIVYSQGRSALIYAVLAKFITFGSIRVVHTRHGIAGPERFFTLFVDTVRPVPDALGRS